MTVQELIDRLSAMVAEDEFRKDAIVTFGPSNIPVEGGIMGRAPSGLVVLNLAPTNLDLVGGF